MIFISHSTKNQDVAKAIRDELQKHNYKCFLSGDDLKADDDWHEEIWRALRECSAFLGVVTDEFNESAFCQQEVGAALALGKPRLLILQKAPKPPGFAARFQACKRSQMLDTLATSKRFRNVRVQAWISAVGSVNSFSAANDAHVSFSGEWAHMPDDEKLRWLLAAAGNNQVYGESYKAGPFYKQAHEELKPLLTEQWLYENDKDGHLHDREANPIGNPAAVPKKKAAKKTAKKRG